MRVDEHVTHHKFELELDVVKFREDSDRVILNGFLGDRLVAEYDGRLLKIIGNEGSLKIYLKEEEINRNQGKR